MKKEGRTGGIEWRRHKENERERERDGIKRHAGRKRKRTLCEECTQARARVRTIAARSLLRSHDRARNFRPKSFTPPRLAYATLPRISLEDFESETAEFRRRNPPRMEEISFIV